MKNEERNYKDRLGVEDLYKNPFATESHSTIVPTNKTR